MSVLATIEMHDVLYEEGVVRYTAKAAIDGDGTGASHGDPDFQPRTSLKERGSSLNADEDIYIVVPPAILDGVHPVVLGCQAFVSYKGKRTPAVVGDVGPRTKLGEISIACAKVLGIPSSPLTGGVSSGVDYEIHPGIPANVNGKSYDLQPS